MKSVTDRPAGRHLPFRAAQRSRGFTAIELMTVVAIVAVLAALAAPNFRPTIERWRVNDTRDAFMASVYLARSESIKRGGGVFLERTAPTAQCRHVNTGQNWGCGWRVVFRAPGSASSTPPEVLRIVPAPSQVNVMVKPQRTSLEFDRWGQAGLNAIGITFSPDPAGVSSVATSTVCIASGGRIRQATGEVNC